MDPRFSPDTAPYEVSSEHESEATSDNFIYTNYIMCHFQSVLQSEAAASSIFKRLE